MISKLHIENFKSLVDFDLLPNGHELGSFTCLIGLNNSGKSTVLQALDFLSHVAIGDVGEWLERRDWRKNELVSHLGTKKPVISFSVSFHTSEKKSLEWSGRYNITLQKCTSETIKVHNEPILKLEDGRLMVLTTGEPVRRDFDSIPFEYQGSVLSTLRLQDARPEIEEVKSAMKNLRSLELLSPHLLRRRARASQDIGIGGEKLSPFLNQLPPKSKKLLLEKLRGFYPQLREWNIKGYRAGWKSLRIQESFPDSNQVEAGHINDGFLRIIAILSQVFAGYKMLLLDEIENGIHPALVGKLMDFLVDLGRKGTQVIVTTHSPIILNYLDDEVARNGVILLYKDDEGVTRSCRYFDQPETGYKLRALGPGEVFVDTDLTKLVQRLTEEASKTALNTGPK
jgi:predicted ATPase